MRVLLTGGRGFIGRHAIGCLLASGSEVHVVSRDARPISGAFVHPGDLHDEQFVSRLIDRIRPTHLLHLAWCTDHGSFWSSPENLRWVATSLDLLRAFADAGGRRVLVAGTCAEYSWNSSVLNESSTPRIPATLYGASKGALREIALSFARVGALSLAWAHIFFLYGPGEDRSRLLPGVVCSILNGQQAKCTAGTQIRDFLHAFDVASALVALLNSDAEGSVNVGSGEPVTIADVAQRAATLAGRPDLLRLGALPARPDEPASIVADVRRLRNEVGWRPSLTLDEGLADVVSWWKRELRRTEHAVDVDHQA